MGYQYTGPINEVQVREYIRLTCPLRVYDFDKACSRMNIPQSIGNKSTFGEKVTAVVSYAAENQLLEELVRVLLQVLNSN